MVGNVGRIPDPQRRTGLNGARPLHVRFQEALQVAAREIPADDIGRQFLTLMESELNLDTIYNAIETSRQRRASPEPTPELRAAWQEIYALITEFNTDAIKLKQLARWLDYARQDWRHILRKLNPDCWTPAPGTFPTNTRSSDLYPTVMDAREAAKQLITRRAWLRGIVSEIESAQTFETWPHGEQAFELCRALFNENVALKAKVTALESAIMALDARLGRLERDKSEPKKSKPKRSTSTQRKLK
jgi:hypothetical protein